MLPALRAVGWDPAHASRRVTKRPWMADEFLKDVMAQFVFAETSVVALIRNSHKCRIWFAANRDLQEKKFGGTNLSLARH